MTTTLIVMNCIIFLIIIVFIGLFIYIFRDYFLYKNDTDNKIDKTSNYINNVIKDIDTNIVHYNNLIDNKYDNITSQINSNIIDKINRNSRIYNNNVDMISSNIFNTSNNVVKFDKNLNRYMTFNTNNPDNINKNFYEYNFANTNNLNIDILKKVNTNNGLTVKTTSELINDRNLNICNDIDNPSCMNFNINEKSLNITPPGGTNDTLNLLNIKNKNANNIASFDLKDNKIFIGTPYQYQSNDKSSPLYIDQGKVYIKQLQLIKPSVVGIGTTSDNRIDPYESITNIENIYNDIFEKNTKTLKIKKDVNICNGDKCIKIESSGNDYNITPTNIDNLNIKDISGTNNLINFNVKNKKIDIGELSSYDIKNNKIYLGGIDNNAPMVINNGNVNIKGTLKINGIDIAPQPT